MSVDYLISRGFAPDLGLGPPDTIDEQNLFDLDKNSLPNGTIAPTLTDIKFDPNRPLPSNSQAGPGEQIQPSSIPNVLPNPTDPDFAAAAAALGVASGAPSDCPSLIAPSRENSKSASAPLETIQCEDSGLPQASTPPNRPSLTTGMSATDFLLPQFCPFGTQTPTLFSDPANFVDKALKPESSSGLIPSATTSKVDFPIPTPSLNLRLPEPKVARKRQASELEDPAMGAEPKRQYRRDESLQQQFVAPQDLTTTAYRSFAPNATINQQFQDPTFTQSPLTNYGQFTSTANFSPSNDPIRTGWNVTSRASSTPTRTPLPPVSYGMQSQASNLMRSATTGSNFPAHVDFSGRSTLPASLLPPPTNYGSSPLDQHRERIRASSYPYPSVPSAARLIDVTSGSQRDLTNSNPASTNQRQKPQCWEHGCNGREFSTFSNLLRHQRERSGTAAKSYCPRCGAEFTRSTARTNHLMHSKCKPQRGGSAE